MAYTISVYTLYPPSIYPVYYIYILTSVYLPSGYLQGLTQSEPPHMVGNRTGALALDNRTEVEVDH